MHGKKEKSKNTATSPVVPGLTIENIKSHHKSTFFKFTSKHLRNNKPDVHISDCLKVVRVKENQRQNGLYLICSKRLLDSTCMTQLLNKHEHKFVMKEGSVFLNRYFRLSKEDKKTELLIEKLKIRQTISLSFRNLKNILEEVERNIKYMPESHENSMRKHPTQFIPRNTFYTHTAILAVTKPRINECLGDYKLKVR